MSDIDLWFAILQLIRDDREDFVILVQDVAILYEAAKKAADATR